ncbi:MAG: TetR/AcrR family transcriptional regulator [Bacteroidales bacterium]|nr:TetR/AcrR family transcriptional regulator [Bacteroidales bacterium]
MKEHIKKTAAVLFAESGYHSTSIVSISQHVGISKGLIIHYFDSKEHLFREVLFEGLEDLRNQFASVEKQIDMIDTHIVYERFSKYLITNKDFVKIIFAVVLDSRLNELYKNEIQFTLRIILNQFKHRPEVNDHLVFSFFVGLALNFVTNRFTKKNLQDIFTLSIMSKLN